MIRALDRIAKALVIVGAVNWGLVGLFHVDPAPAVFGMNFGEVSILGAVVYTLIGLADLYRALMLGAAPRREASTVKI